MEFSSPEERDNFIIKHLPLVNYTIKMYFFKDHNIVEDMRQHGAIGLIKSVDSYNESLGSFSTYAIINIRRSIQEIFRKNRAKKRTPELSPVPMNKSFCNGKLPLSDIISDNINIDEEVSNNIIIQQFIQFIESYKSPDKEIMIYLHDLDDLNRIGKNKSQREVAKKFNITQMEVSRINSRVLEQFRRTIKL
jgi:RNA polymerase sigma factor (sigma-70 family)